MTLTPGTKLGPYEVLSPLGAGGMGEVYRARDIKLHREVALKVLPEDFARDPIAMRRFEREAQLLASLNHPHIAVLYGLEESDASCPALVMELVEGPTLAGRILGGPLPVKEALGIARQLAEALESAHQRGIIHRDLKPANVKLTKDGAVKILDFGLAKAFLGDPLAAPGGSPGASSMSSPTISSPATLAGAILGTAAYMSPEQARGKPLDRRTDIWSFGCVLYELLTGQRAFPGETVSDTVATVLTCEPDWDALPAKIPASLNLLLHRCLQKNLTRRLHDMADARIEIEDAITALAHPTVPGTFAGQVSPPSRSLRRTAIAYGLFVIALLLAFAAGFWVVPRNKPVSREWSGTALGGPAIGFDVRASPDGRMMAFLAMVDGLTQVAVMNPDSGNWTVLTHDRSKGAADAVSWSRDSARIYFTRLNPDPVGIFSVPPLGGDERLVLENASAPQVLPDGSFLITIPPSSGKRQLCHFWPDSGRIQPMGVTLWQWGPLEPVARIFSDGEEAVFAGIMGQASDPEPHVYAMEIKTGRVRQLAPELKLDSNTLASNAMAVSLDGKSVLIDVKAGDLHRIVAIPRHDSPPVRVLMSLTEPSWSMDRSSDGALYVDQVDRPLEFLRLPVAGGAPERWAAQRNPQSLSSPLQCAGGRILLPSVVSGRGRLVVAKPGKDPVTFVDTEEETSPPMAFVGDKLVGFLIGAGAGRTIAVASIEDGRILRRLQSTRGLPIQSISASTDGAMIYYTAAGSVWKVAASDAEPQKLGPGEYVAFDPHSSGLIVARDGALFRLATSGGPQKPIPLQGGGAASAGLRIAPTQLASNAVGRDGRIAITVVARDYWFYQAAILDPVTGKMTKVPVNYEGDLAPPAWASDGRLLANGYPLKSAVWRFRPSQ